MLTWDFRQHRSREFLMSSLFAPIPLRIQLCFSLRKPHLTEQTPNTKQGFDYELLSKRKIRLQRLYEKTLGLRSLFRPLQYLEILRLPLFLFLIFHGGDISGLAVCLSVQGEHSTATSTPLRPFFKQATSLFFKFLDNARNILRFSTTFCSLFRSLERLRSIEILPTWFVLAVSRGDTGSLVALINKFLFRCTSTCSLLSVGFFCYQIGRLLKETLIQPHGLLVQKKSSSFDWHSLRARFLQV